LSQQDTPDFNIRQSAFTFTGCREIATVQFQVNRAGATIKAFFVEMKPFVR
jgi:hypothetical protein